MKKLIGLWLVMLIVGMTVSAGASNNYVKAATTGPYEEFWRILNREAELVIQFNSTGNVSLAQELIQNSRLGAENAVNVSALIWQALEELKSSGVKTYYTAQELQEMAQNISQSGLPNETVQSLKAQGWTDTQIQALEEYIAQNAGEINQDFNMTAFLEEFSMAFINVAFKYNEYEAWTLKRWKWTSTQKAPQVSGGYLMNPALGGDWVILYLRYSQRDYQRMEPAAKTLRQSMYDLITGAGGSVTLLSYGESASPSPLQGSVDSIIWVENGGLLITVTTKKTTTTEVITEKTTYYWPSALRAYELVGNVYTLIKARNYGNNNPKIDSILNQKIAELKEALKVAVVSSEVTSTPITNPTPVKPVPIKPGDPVIPDPLPKLPLDSTTTTGTITTGSSDAGGVTLDGVLIDSNVLRGALDTQNDPGILTITDVAVIVDKNVSGEVTYHVKVSLKAENNAVSNIGINVKDYTTGGSDSGTVSFLNSGESYTWNTKGFTLAHTMAGELIVSGKVEIAYTPSCGAVPLSGNQGVLSTSPSCQERTVTKEYSATINLKSPVDWRMVGIRVEASRESITKGESVTYRVIVENNNSKALSGVRYSITVPYSITKSSTQTGTTDVPANGKTILYEKTITYTDTGTYVVHASIYWNGHSKSASKSVTVTSGTLSITGVDVSPANPTHGDSVSFDVSVKNPVSRSRTLTVKLFIDGQEKSRESLTIGAGGSGVVSLTWTAQAGEHAWRVEVWEGRKLEASRSGSIRVNSNGDSQKSGSNTINANLEITDFACMPKEVGLYEWRLDRDKVSCTVTIQNKGPEIQIAPRVVIDDIETFWLNIRTLPINSSINLQYEVKFSDGLAQIMYGPSATALSFVRTVEESGGTVCQRGVCYNSTRIYYLPENHTISLKIYKAINFMPTTEALTQSEKEVITVKYDGYVEKKTMIYYFKIGKTSAEVLGLYLTVEYAAVKAGAEAGLKELGKEFLKKVLDWLVG
ncbi:hypothetical protein [Thermococcus thermotolerans]|uniref:hypothetical protein n=1 Tax=Thermococcus thermotolerans TaxID=2969672 RepID=UPI0021571F05|nr:hypothetical protein [Thermococcus thermotolerans]